MKYVKSGPKTKSLLKLSSIFIKQPLQLCIYEVLNPIPNAYVYIEDVLVSELTSIEKK